MFASLTAIGHRQIKIAFADGSGYDYMLMYKWHVRCAQEKLFSLSIWGCNSLPRRKRAPVQIILLSDVSTETVF